MYRSLMLLVSVLDAFATALAVLQTKAQVTAMTAEDKALLGAETKAEAKVDAARQRLHRARLEVLRAESALDDEGKRCDAKLDALYAKHGYLVGGV